MQEVGGNHAKTLGVGYDDMKNSGISWLLSRVYVKLGEMPVWGESFNVETWAYGIEKLHGVRYFRFSRDNGEVFARVNTLWLVIDLKKMRPLRPAEAWQSIRSHDEKLEIPMPEKLQPLENALAVHERHVRYSDIDVMQHVNNTRYVEWFQDALPTQFWEKNQLKSFQINYIHEIKENEDIGIYVKEKQENSQLHLSHEIRNNETTNARIESQWNVRG